jgi:hypothetical protein
METNSAGLLGVKRRDAHEEHTDLGYVLDQLDRLSILCSPIEPDERRIVVTDILQVEYYRLAKGYESDADLLSRLKFLLKIFDHLCKSLFELARKVRIHPPQRRDTLRLCMGPAQCSQIDSPKQLRNVSHRSLASEE